MVFTDLSIIIPVYNGERTIGRCLESVYSTGLPEDCFEIIVVDDCSTDQTVAILESYSTIHRNIHVLRQHRNQRQGAARNRGLGSAVGRFILFLDADDEVMPGLKSVLEYALEAKLEIVFFQKLTQFKENGEFITQDVSIPEKTRLSGGFFCSCFYDMDNPTGFFTSYLYLRSFIERVSIPFVENRVNEDADWCEKHLWLAESIEFVDIVVYKNFCNPNSTMHTLSASRDADTIMLSYRRLLFADSIKQSHFTEVISRHACSWVSSIFSLRHMSRHSFRNCQKVFSGIEKDAYLFLRQRNWKGFTRICLLFPQIASFFVFLIHPFSRIVRLMKSSFLY